MLTLIRFHSNYLFLTLWCHWLQLPNSILFRGSLLKQYILIFHGPSSREFILSPSVSLSNTIQWRIHGFVDGRGCPIPPQSLRPRCAPASVGSVDLSSVIWRGVILFVCPVDTNICGYFSIPFFKLIVPTVDTVRYSYLTSSLIAKFHPVLLVGPVGTGKTSVAETVINSLDAKTYSVLVVNMSAQVSHHEKLKKFWKFQYKLNK